MIVKLLIEHHLVFLNLTGGCSAEVRPSLHMSKCHIFGNHMHWLNFNCCHFLHCVGACVSSIECRVPLARALSAGKQGCGNTMPDLSDLLPFHSGQVENYNLLVLGQVQNLYRVNKILYFIL